MIRRQVREAGASVLGDKRQVRVTINTESTGRDEIVVLTNGIGLTAYRQNPIVLWQHDPCQPIGRAIELSTVGGKLTALVQFPPAGASPKADEILALIQAGVINAASTGFEVQDAEPIDPKSRDSGIKITSCELQEFSFVSIPALPDALVTERAHRAAGHADDGRAARRALAETYMRELGVPGFFDAAKPSQAMRKTLKIHERMASGSKSDEQRMRRHRRMAALYERQLAVEERRKTGSGNSTWRRG